MGRHDQASFTSLRYEWPNDDPKYWQDLVEYVCEAENEGNKPATWEEFQEDFELWMKGTEEEGQVQVETHLEGDAEGWVRVHSPEDESKSDEEFLTRNLLREMVEVFHHGEPRPEDVAWWKTDLGQAWEKLILEYSEKVTAEFQG